MNEKIEITANQYSYMIFEIVKISSKSYFALIEHIQFDDNILTYLTYIEYAIYMCKKIISKKHKEKDVRKYIEGIWEWLKIYLEENKLIYPDKLDGVVDLMKKNYLELEKENISIEPRIELERLVDKFMVDAEMEKESATHYNVFLCFSGFIIHHSEGLLNEKIIIN